MVGYVANSDDAVAGMRLVAYLDRPLRRLLEDLVDERLAVPRTRAWREHEQIATKRRHARVRSGWLYS